jgi:hypothetical protein
VAVQWWKVRKDGGTNPWLLKTYWLQATESEPYGLLLKETYSSQVDGMLRWANQKDWDLRLLGKLPQLRKQNQRSDFLLAGLVYYNEDIDEEERERRWGRLERAQTEEAIILCVSWTLAPKPDVLFPEEWRLAI